MSNIVHTHIFIDDQPSITKRSLLLPNKPNPSLVGIGRGTPIILKDGSGADRQEQDEPLIGIGRGTPIVPRDQNSKTSWVILPVDTEESEKSKNPDALAKLKTWPYLVYKYWMVTNIVWTSLAVLGSVIDILEAGHEISMINQYNQTYRNTKAWIIAICFDVVFLLLRIWHLGFTWKAIQAIRKQDSSKMAVVIKMMKIYIALSVIVEYFYMTGAMFGSFGSGYASEYGISAIYFGVMLAVKFAFFYLFYMYGALKIKKIL